MSGAEQKRFWHLYAALVHTLLGGANLLFWRIFIAFKAIPLGIITTAAHVVFVIAQGSLFVQINRDRAFLEERTHEMSLYDLKRPFYTGRSALVLLGETIRVTWRRARSGPRLSDWSWLFEVMTGFLQRQERIASAMPAMADQRLYTDALVLPSPALRKVHRESITDETVRGCWYTPLSDVQERTVLYLHGGGYAFYSRMHENLIALMALAARARTFALDYRLTPEHTFPAQLEDALAAYRMTQSAWASTPSG